MRGYFYLLVEHIIVNKNKTIMIVLGIVLMIVGGAIFTSGEQQSCLLMIIGGIINFAGIGVLMSAF